MSISKTQSKRKAKQQRMQLSTKTSIYLSADIRTLPNKDHLMTTAIIIRSLATWEKLTSLALNQNIPLETLFLLKNSITKK